MNKLILLLLLFVFVSCDGGNGSGQGGGGSAGGQGQVNHSVMKCLDQELELLSNPPRFMDDFLERTKKIKNCKATDKDLQDYTNFINKNDPFYMARIQDGEQ